MCMAQLSALHTGRVLANAASSVQLSYDVPVGCPPALALTGAIDAQLGDGYATDTVLRARVRVVARGARVYELSVDYSAASGVSDRRLMHAESCAAAVDAAALVLALALNPIQPAPLPAPMAAASPAETPTASSEPSFTLAALALLDTALLQKPALGGALRIGVGLGPLQFSLGATYFVPDRVSSDAGTATLTFWSVDVGACYLTAWGPLALGPCGHFELGRQAGEVRGHVEAARSDGARLQAAALGGEVRVALSERFWLVADAAIEWIARRPQFVVTGSGTVGSANPFGARLGLGPQLVW